MKKRATRPILDVSAVEPEYPTRLKHTLRDPGRRRFLRQLGIGAGVVSALGPVGQASGQEPLDADFSILSDPDPIMIRGRMPAPHLR